MTGQEYWSVLFIIGDWNTKEKVLSWELRALWAQMTHEGRAPRAVTLMLAVSALQPCVSWSSVGDPHTTGPYREAAGEKA